MRRLRDARDDWTLFEIAGSEEEPVERGTRFAESDAVDRSGHAVLELGAACCAPAHREAHDVGGAGEARRGNVAAAPAHTPRPPVGTEREVAHALVAEVRPRLARIALPGIEDFD